MIGRTNVGGGSSAVAYIKAYYPSGYVCTCSQNLVTLSSGSSVGSHIFKLPSTGTWTLTATDGETTITKSITVVADDLITVKMSGEIYNADGVNGWAVGAVKEGTESTYTIITPILTATAEGNYLQAEASSYAGWPCATTYWQTPIDFTDFDTLKITFNYNVSNYNLYMCIWDQPPTSNGLITVGLVTSRTVLTAGTQTLPIDVSSLSGHYYFGFTTVGSGGTLLRVIVQSLVAE